jgi:hypothetical protein
MPNLRGLAILRLTPAIPEPFSIDHLSPDTLAIYHQKGDIWQVKPPSPFRHVLIFGRQPHVGSLNSGLAHSATLFLFHLRRPFSSIFARNSSRPGPDGTLRSKEHARFLGAGSTSPRARRTTGLFGTKRKIYLGPYAVKTAEYSHLQAQSEA